MAPYSALFSDAAGLCIAVLYTIAGQAHFTSRFTPGMAAQIDVMTPNSHQAFWFLGLNYLAFRRFTGGLDLLAALLLWRKPTRKAGLFLAIIGFSGGLYGQVYSGGDLGQVSALLGLAIAGLLTAP